MHKISWFPSLIAEEDDVVHLDEAVELPVPQQLLQELVLLLGVHFRGVHLDVPLRQLWADL